MYLKYVLHERMYMTFRGALFNICVELRVVHLFKRSIYYRPQKKFGARECFYTCLSFCLQIPLDAEPPSNTVNKWAVCILLECTLVVLSTNSLISLMFKFTANRPGKRNHCSNFTKTIFGGVQVSFQ